MGKLYLRPITKPVAPERPFAVFDIEAAPLYPGEPINTAFLAGGFYDGTSYTECKTLDALYCKLLEPRYEGWSIYAHNGSGYDFIYLLEEMVRRGQPFSAYKTGGRFFVTVRGRDFLDSLCVLKGSLASVAESLKVKTQKREVPEDFFPNIRKYWGNLGRAYLKDDCICLYECIASLRGAFRKLGCNLKSTLASTALELFQREFLERPIEAQPWHHSSERIAREAYVGGRTEIFKREMGIGTSHDINSSYPFAMLKEVPTDFLGYYEGDTIPHCGLVHATVQIPPDEHIPPLHHRAGGKLFFPTGKLSGWYTSREIAYCREKYGKQAAQVDRFVTYKPEAIFKRYVETLYARRLEAKAAGDAATSEACKLALNTLYGKTGTNRVRQQIVCGENYYWYPWNDEKALTRLKKHKGWKGTTRESLLCYEYNRERYIYGIPSFVDYAPYILPAIAATITAAGRMQLQGYLDEAGRALVYCDTDSIYREGRNNFLGSVGKNLGQLKHEADIRSGHFALPKCYFTEIEKPDGTTETKGAAKGLPRKNLDAAIRYIKGEAVEVPRMLGAVETLRLTGEITPRSEMQTKQLSRHVVHKRHPSGRAFTIDEIAKLPL